MINEYLTLMRFEWVITLVIFLLLFIKLGGSLSNERILLMVYVLLAASLALAFAGKNQGRLFAGMFVSTSLIVVQKFILALATLLLLMNSHDWLKKHEHLPEFLLLIASALLGMFMMLSSGNLLLFYLALELSTIPVAALANFELTKARSSEAAIKMILSSAFSSGIMLFGISLIYGLTGTVLFGEIPGHLRGVAPLEIIAFLFFFSGLAFKLSVVPYHLWTADVYEGSPVPVTAFLSIVSKGSVAFVLITFLYKVFQPLGAQIYPMLMLLAIATVIIGNLFAIRQQNLKRFLAFSSIAQVAFILLGISSGSYFGTAAVTYFLLVYAFSNLAAFGVISIVASATGRETLQEYKGMYRNNKLLGWTMAIALFSLAGIPPTAGFFGKFYLIMAGAMRGNVWFVGLMVINLVVSLYYYLRVVRAIFMDENMDLMPSIRVSPVPRIGLLICLAAIVVAGFVGVLYEHILALSQY